MHRSTRSIPPGWQHNPTAWRRRGPLLALAAAGLAIATYLMLYQLGAYASVWDPIFGGRATRTVLDLTAPVPDAAAGVIAYATEIGLLALGGAARWRSMPWTCIALGVVLVTGAVVSIALIIVQPALAGAWCALCLGSAAVSLVLFALGIGEALAAWEEVRRLRGRGRSLVQALSGA